MRPIVSVLGVMGLALGASMAAAQQPQGFSGKVALGYLATSGNSENESLNASFDLDWNYDPWTHSLNGQSIKSSTSGVTTAEAYSLGWQSRYALSENAYVFGLISLDKDEFSAYDKQIREVIGYGRRFIDNDRHVFNAQAGLGARQADLRNGTSEDETILYLGGDYKLTISEASEFTQTLAIEHGSDNTFTVATSALSAKIRENFALVLSYTIKNNSDVLPGTEKTDTFTAISLEYTF